MEQWEYWTEFVFANIESPGAAEFIRQGWPDRKPPKFTPETMIPHLNAFGEVGWELVHMQPVVVGRNADVGFVHGGGAPGVQWSNAYFCVFKRRVQA